jgi:hypothetical protein
MYELTIFKNRYDNKTHKTMSFQTWDAFVDLLYSLSEKPDTKATAPLISPAVYDEGTTRSNNNVRVWGKWAAVDVDDVDIDADELRETLLERFGHWDFVCYSTASSSLDRPKFRLVFNLMETVHRDNISKFWFALNTEIGDIGDAQTKDLSRMYYVPAKYDGAHNFIFHNSGNPIDVDYLVIKHPYKERTGNSFLDRLPPELQKVVVEHRKSQTTNTNYSWTDYRDCPFWPRNLASEYQTINETGWYRKLYQIMVATAGNAVNKGYPITSGQISDLCKQFDMDNGKWYDNRPLEKEADRAIEFVYRNL